MCSIAAAGFSIIAKTKILAEEAATFFKLGAGASSVSTSFSMALIGVGHLVGITGFDSRLSGADHDPLPR